METVDILENRYKGTADIDQLSGKKERSHLMSDDAQSDYHPVSDRLAKRSVSLEDRELYVCVLSYGGKNHSGLSMVKQNFCLVKAEGALCRWQDQSEKQMPGVQSQGKSSCASAHAVY